MKILSDLSVNDVKWHYKPKIVKLEIQSKIFFSEDDHEKKKHCC